MRTILPLTLALMAGALTGCSAIAERKNPEDVSLVRMSCSEAGGVYSLFAGKTVVCQATGLKVDKEYLQGYHVTITKDGYVFTNEVVSGIGEQL